MIPPKPRAAVDATGLEARHASRHFYWRAGRRTRRSSGPRLSAVLDTRSHVFLSAVVTRGPGHDAGQFRPAAKAAAARCPIDTLLGDAAYDGEHHHAYARERLGIRSTVFRVYRRGRAGRREPPRVSTAGRRPSGSGASRRGAGPSGCTASGGRSRAGSAGTSGCSGVPSGPAGGRPRSAR